MKIYGIGLPKTGTTTLIKALEILGHEDISVGDYVYFIKNKLPGKYILTIRKSPDVWFNSVLNWSKKHSSKKIRKNRKIMYGFEMPQGHRKEFIKKYNQHNKRMIEKYNPLIVCWETGSGWKELCDYLGDSIPDKPFPHVNKQIYNMITVGLPVWNGKEITWLTMESFCRQKTTCKWELIVFEEEHDQACGRKFFDSYKKRLKKAGGELVYMTAKEKNPLSYKWKKIAGKANKKSKMFCICGADNYYQENMVQDAMNAYKEGYDWLTTRIGYFFNLLSGKLAKFDISQNKKANTGLQMAVSTKLIRNIPYIEKHRLLDNWMYNFCKPEKPMSLMKNFESLGTHGFNNISLKRGKKIDKIEPPFYKTDKKLSDILPKDIEQKLCRQVVL